MSSLYYAFSDTKIIKQFLNNSIKSYKREELSFMDYYATESLFLANGNYKFKLIYKVNNFLNLFLRWKTCLLEENAFPIF